MQCMSYSHIHTHKHTDWEIHKHTCFGSIHFKQQRYSNQQQQKWSTENATLAQHSYACIRWTIAHKLYLGQLVWPLCHYFRIHWCEEWPIKAINKKQIRWFNSFNFIAYWWSFCTPRNCVRVSTTSTIGTYILKPHSKFRFGCFYEMAMFFSLLFFFVQCHFESLFISTANKCNMAKI